MNVNTLNFLFFTNDTFSELNLANSRFVSLYNPKFCHFFLSFVVPFSLSSFSFSFYVSVALFVSLLSSHSQTLATALSSSSLHLAVVALSSISSFFVCLVLLPPPPSSLHFFSTLATSFTLSFIIPLSLNSSSSLNYCDFSVMTPPLSLILFLYLVLSFS